MSRIQLTTLLGLAAIIWGILLILNGIHISIPFFKPFSLVVGILAIILGLFDKWIWRFRWLHPWFVSRPNLQGTWKGSVTPSGINVESRTPNAPIRAYLVIRQTYSSISIRLFTEESSSELLAGNIVESSDGLYTVFGTYRNTPRLQKRDGSPIHYGGLLLNVQGTPVKELGGEYWTDRSTRGELHFEHRVRTLAQSFAQAQLRPTRS